MQRLLRAATYFVMLALTAAVTLPWWAPTGPIPTVWINVAIPANSIDIWIR